MGSEYYTGAPPNHKHDGSDITTGTVGSAYGGVPSGAILLWHGLLANIPSGWLLCDGGSSTPDLREKFVRGAPASTEAGTTGGEDSHTLTTSEIPAHTHTISRPEGGVASGGADGFAGSGTATSSSTGGGSAHENRPAFYEVQYIMKS